MSLPACGLRIKRGSSPHDVSRMRVWQTNMPPMKEPKHELYGSFRTTLNHTDAARNLLQTAERSTDKPKDKMSILFYPDMFFFSKTSTPQRGPEKDYDLFCRPPCSYVCSLFLGHEFLLASAGLVAVSAAALGACRQGFPSRRSAALPIH